MIIYGGIYEVTKELNDMHVFDLRQDKWVCLFQEQNSPKKFSGDGISPLKRNTLKENAMDLTAQHTMSRQRTKKPQTANKSPSKSKKLRMLMLKPKEQEQIIKLESPVSNSMKNSFLIKNSDPSFEKAYHQIKKRTGEKTEQKTFDQFLTKTSGKRPPARDGHTVSIVHN